MSLCVLGKYEKYENHVTNHIKQNKPKKWKKLKRKMFIFTAGSWSSWSKERTLMDEDWWLVSVLIPEEGRTSVITISSSNTQSLKSMAPKWHKRLCCSPESTGKLRPFSGKGMCFGKVLWLFILVCTESEGTSVFLDGSGKGFPPT